MLPRHPVSGWLLEPRPVSGKPAFLTTRRGEVRERAVRTRREPLSAGNIALKIFH
ncbi:MAG: hypothetical protein OXB98_20795 [Bryobacterales bacterium]|nr:hypothetical protein [Bryobacterales bacterium]